MQNACKHAGERATIRLRLREEPGTLTFEVIDDGAGFDAVGRGLGAGFLNMTDRLGAFGGGLRVDSAPGQGTRITGTVPVAARPGSGTVAAGQQWHERLGVRAAPAGDRADRADEAQVAACVLVG
jgi:signal transduction histidine kinase